MASTYPRDVVGWKAPKIPGRPARTLSRDHSAFGKKPVATSPMGQPRDASIDSGPCQDSTSGAPYSKRALNNNTCPLKDSARSIGFNGQSLKLAQSHF
ncbi:unnamed protein product [Aspergillus oryzae]|uniref:Unnamed protein product n=2 Tax=Aspergillus oryzae TaxID=5062 RepID=A0AAN5C3I8_ASPOZ|nr:unnamed protein product [Aspergillus oryzae]GMF91700.1 unnamed protein product [Aspergillus oryzae]GMG04856.1 unnamed protein product [Aspergillus oryzae]GMG36460.1 unnamed protein product [Aspergillus oryzae]GMG51132.1 unnamed protein product [Aspergillus oryzae var. brunneus]